MAEQRDFEEQAQMDAYFNGDDAYDVSIDPAPVVPRSHAAKNRTPSNKRSRRAAMGKRILAAICALTAVGLIGGIVIYINIRRNDGAKYAEKLSLSIGASVADAQKISKIELTDASEYPLLNQLIPSSGSMYESTKSAKIQGVTMPEWLIHCDINDGVVGEITYYNFEILEDNAYGIERKTYLDPASLSVGCTPDQAESILGLSPYATYYHTDRTETREYRYCYEDGETGNLTAYIITTKWSAEGGMVSASDVRVDFLAQILGIGQQSAKQPAE